MIANTVKYPNIRFTAIPLSFCGFHRALPCAMPGQTSRSSPDPCPFLPQNVCLPAIQSGPIGLPESCQLTPAIHLSLLDKGRIPNWVKFPVGAAVKNHPVSVYRHRLEYEESMSGLSLRLGWWCFRWVEFELRLLRGDFRGGPRRLFREIKGFDTAPRRLFDRGLVSQYEDELCVGHLDGAVR